ncbi:MAG: hypothetical protein JNK16_07045 [Phycisphaerales bacterium]|nr:hypothetical protein [Phycisphaerales bacterium]
MATPTLPTFTPDGVLPPGDYALSLEQLRESILVLGPGAPKDHPVWDASWRLQLVTNLRVMVEQLWQVGIDEIFIDGSFVEDKDHPNDIDGYFVCEEQRVRTRSLHRDLNTIDPAKCWTWDHTTRRAFRGYPKKQLPMWHAYRVELYPHWTGLVAGTDAHGNQLEFPAWFRQRRGDGQAKGIVKILK